MSAVQAQPDIRHLHLNLAFNGRELAQNSCSVLHGRCGLAKPVTRCRNHYLQNATKYCRPSPAATKKSFYPRRVLPWGPSSAVLFQLTFFGLRRYGGLKVALISSGFMDSLSLYRMSSETETLHIIAIYTADGLAMFWIRIWHSLLRSDSRERTDLASGPIENKNRRELPRHSYHIEGRVWTDEMPMYFAEELSHPGGIHTTHP